MTMAKKIHDLDGFLDKIYLCLEKNKPIFTDFLNPQQHMQFMSALKSLGNYDVIVEENGGYPNAERKMLGLAPIGTVMGDFPIAGIKLDFDARYGGISHRDALGAVLGLGLDRDVVGDVVLLVSNVVFFVQARIGDFIIQNLHKVGRVRVSAAFLSTDAHFYPLDNHLEERVICTSLRLDCLLAAVFKLSRSEATALVKSGKVYVNWQESNSPSKSVKENDMVTLRRFGRIQIKEICGKSRKDRFLVDILRY